MTNSYKQILLHQCSPLHIFSGVFLFSFFFLETQTLSGVDDQDVVIPCRVIVIDCFSTDFIANWIKTKNWNNLVWKICCMKCGVWNQMKICKCECKCEDASARIISSFEIIYVITFLSFENQLPLLSIARYSKRNQKTVGQTLASHFWRLIYPSFSQSRMRHKWKCNR